MKSNKKKNINEEKKKILELDNDHHSNKYKQHESLGCSLDYWKQVQKNMVVNKDDKATTTKRNNSEKNLKKILNINSLK
jgi:hypothetical protein